MDNLSLGTFRCHDSLLQVTYGDEACNVLQLWSARMTVDAELNPELVRQEEERLRKLHPTPEDIPGCMKLFDDFLLCNGSYSPSCDSFEVQPQRTFC